MHMKQSIKLILAENTHSDITQIGLPNTGFSIYLP
jgi:hypothetical protein